MFLILKVVAYWNPMLRNPSFLSYVRALCKLSYSIDPCVSSHIWCFRHVWVRFSVDMWYLKFRPTCYVHQSSILSNKLQIFNLLIKSLLVKDRSRTCKRISIKNITTACQRFDLMSHKVYSCLLVSALWFQLISIVFCIALMYVASWPELQISHIYTKAHPNVSETPNMTRDAWIYWITQFTKSTNITQERRISKHWISICHHI
jgi:hypothetical protein